MFESSTLASPQTSNQKQFATSFPEALKQDTTKKIEELFALFANNSEEVEVSFRDLVHWIKLGERGTHYLHAYPAKLLPQIAHFFLASRKLCPPNGTVLDPFGGTGTVALETLISGRNAAYVDANPLARLIASAKVQVVAIDACKKALHEVELAFRKSRKRTPPNVVNIEKWYSQKAILGLTRLSAAINSQKDEKIHTLLQVTLSAVARKVSNTDPRLSVPVYCEFTAQASRKKEDVWARFEEQFNSNLRRLIELEKLAPHYRDQSFTIVAHDARRVVEQSGGALKAGSVDLVITSPPYAGAQKYIRASSLSLGWLGIAGNGQLKSLENESIGREHLPRAESRTIPKTSLRDANKLISLVYEKNQKRAAICATYLNEMEKALYEISASLKKDGYLVLVIGNNMVCGHEFPSSDYLTQMILKMNFALRCSLIDKIRSRGLMTKRNRTASVILAERVLVFQKKMTGKLSAPPLLTNIEIETWDALVSRILTLNERAWEDGLNTTQIQSWLENFQGFTGAPMDRERLHALYMLSQFMYFGSKEIKVLLKAIYRELYLLPLVSKVKDANRHLTQFQAALTAAMTSTRFLGLGNASESGPLLLYPFRQENELKKKQFLEVGEIYKTDNAGVRVPADTSITRYVFIDDICGSGDTASKFSTRELLELAAAPGVELYYFSMFATKDGLDFVKKNTVFGQNADAIFELDESYKWTHSRSRYMSVMPLGIDENLLRNMATTYGSQIDRSWPLGWNNDELLIGFKHNTPDNTLPVIWSSLQNGSQRSWYPVFNRFPKV